MRLEADIPEFFEFLRDGGYPNDHKVIFLLGVFLMILKILLQSCSKGSRLKKVWQKSLPNIVAFMLR